MFAFRLKEYTIIPHIHYNAVIRKCLSAKGAKRGQKKIFSMSTVRQGTYTKHRNRNTYLYEHSMPC